VQRDIVLKFLDPNAKRDYTDLVWPISKAVANKRQQIVEWMLLQFESKYVQSHLPVKAVRDEARRLFEAALNNGLITFF
jgi:hypothetical protein